MLHEYLEVPFVTTLLGVTVTVAAIDLTADDQIVAVCRRGRDLLKVSLLELPLPDPRPAGAEWVDALSPVGSTALTSVCGGRCQPPPISAAPAGAQRARTTLGNRLRMKRMYSRLAENKSARTISE